jgi:hypothetical protein
VHIFHFIALSIQVFFSAKELLPLPTIFSLAPYQVFLDLKFKILLTSFSFAIS